MDSENMTRKPAILQKTATQGLKLHPAWIALIRHCQEIDFGEIERIKIQSGIPVLVEKSTQRIKLT